MQNKSKYSREEENIRKNAERLDAFRGCLVGGAIGDALGYPVEFWTLRQIHGAYGAEGIRDYKRANNGLALLSDDTQMTLFTATGLLLGQTRGMTRGIGGIAPDYIYRSYRTWYEMQMGKTEFPQNAHSFSWLCDVPEMGAHRAPGTTCLSALGSGQPGAIATPLNHSKGCGGVMRVAPVGLYLHRRATGGDPLLRVDWFAAEVAALTHGHPLGYISAAGLAHIVNRVTHGNMSIPEAVADAILALEAFGKDAQALIDLMQQAVCYATNAKSDATNIAALGQGWVAEETLAIAVYCALRYPDDFSKAVIAAVNHDGDSDSTGAVTGNILGAALGYEKIPQQWKENLECLDVILEIADDLCHDCQLEEYSDYRDPAWTQKYICNRRYYPDQEQSTTL